MREIKFRGKSIKDGKWYYGYFLVNSFGEYTICGKDFAVQVIPETVGQFTGLLAKDKEIYSGDIIRVWTWVNEDEPETNDYKDYKVYWDDEYTAFMIDWEYDDVDEHSLGVAISFWDNDRDLAVDWQIIGNIYENEELLEAVK